VFSFARINHLWLAAAAVKAPDELAALGLDRRLASYKSPNIRAKENIRYELTRPQNALTPTGLLMEGQRAHPPDCYRIFIAPVGLSASLRLPLG
jgi:hypothetical protein